MMKVIVFGATGQTGKHVINALVKNGERVTAFARNPANVDTHDGAVVVITGDAREADAVARAIRGQDAVLSAFGPRSLKKDDLQEVFMRNLIAGMEQAGVKRLIQLSAWGAGDSYPQASLLFKISRHTLLKYLYDDKNKAENLLSASSLDYTNVRPGRLENKPAKGMVRAAADGRGLSRSTARPDVAAFMVAQLNDASWIRKSPLIGYS